MLLKKKSNIIITVPLILKIYKKILPVINQPVMKFLLKIEGLNKLILKTQKVLLALWEAILEVVIEMLPSMPK